MSEEITHDDAVSTTAKVAPTPTHAEMFFRYVAALAQAAGVQAFTLSVAVPKEDGTSAVMALAAGLNNSSREWQEETSKLLGEQAVAACKNIIQPEQKPAEIV